MVTLTPIQRHETKFEALIAQAKNLHAEFSASDERATELRAQLGLVLKLAKENKPDDMTWPAVVKARFSFSAEWANVLIREVEGRSTPEARREQTRGHMQKHRANSVSRDTENPPDKSTSKLLKQNKALADTKTKLREEKERRERSNERAKWLQHEFATSQSVVTGLTHQIETLRNAPVVTRFKEIWKNANEAERAEIAAIVNASA